MKLKDAIHVPARSTESNIRDLTPHQLGAVAKLLGIHVQISFYNDAVEDVEVALAKLSKQKRIAIENEIQKMALRSRDKSNG